MSTFRKYPIVFLLAVAFLLPSLSYGAPRTNRSFYGTYEIVTTGDCAQAYYLTFGGKSGMKDEEGYIYLRAKGSSFTKNDAVIKIKGRTITYSWTAPGDAGSITFNFARNYKTGTVNGEVTEGTCTGTITGKFSRRIKIDWTRYLNYEVGRAWQYNRSTSSETFSEYIREVTTKGGQQDVYVLGWSLNYSDWLDYRIFKPEGVYFVGFYDDEDKMKDVFFPKPFLILRSNIEFGRTYVQRVAVSKNQSIVMRTKYELVRKMTVPQGTHENVIKVTWTVVNGENKIYWYALDTGMIREYNIVKKKNAELLNITDGSSRPVN